MRDQAGDYFFVHILHCKCTYRHVEKPLGKGKDKKGNCLFVFSLKKINYKKLQKDKKKVLVLEW